MTGSYEVFVDMFLAKMKAIPGDKRESKLRETIFEFLPTLNDELFDALEWGEFLDVEVEAYGASVRQVMNWAFVAMMEERYDEVMRPNLFRMIDAIESNGYRLEFEDDDNFVNIIQDETDKVIGTGKGSGLEYLKFIEMMWNHLLNGVALDG